MTHRCWRHRQRPSDTVVGLVPISRENCHPPATAFLSAACTPARSFMFNVSIDLTPMLIPVPTGVLLLSLRTPVVSGP